MNQTWTTLDGTVKAMTRQHGRRCCRAASPQSKGPSWWWPEQGGGQSTSENTYLGRLAGHLGARKPSFSSTTSDM